jgi:CRISPR/Cas system CSM-associated protein Csm3 (group 7 of RAMP superfamily)
MVRVGNAVIPDYERVIAWVRWGQSVAGPDLGREQILSSFTQSRVQTAIDRNLGIADDHTLRRVRELRRGLTFVCALEVERDESDAVTSLALATLGIRSIGLARNRGYGRVHCELRDPAVDRSLSNELRVKLRSLLPEVRSHRDSAEAEGA